MATSAAPAISKQIFTKIWRKTMIETRRLIAPALPSAKEAKMRDPNFEDELIELGAASELTQGAEAEEIEQIVLFKREIE